MAGKETVRAKLDRLRGRSSRGEKVSVDASALLADESGALPEGYCRDGYVHLNNAGAKIVVDALYQFASQEA